MMKNYFILLAGCLLLWLSAPFTVKADAADYDVRQYGANGSDTMDDYDAIQDALDEAINSNEPITVIIPPGTYYLYDHDLHIFSNTTLKANGATIIRKSGNNSVMIKNWPKDKSIPNTYGGYECSTNITIQGGTWDGNAGSSIGSNLFYFFHASNINISDVTIKNCSGHHFIEFAGVKDSTITNCSFSNFIKLAGINYIASDDTETDLPAEESADQASIVSEAIQLDYTSKKTSTGSVPYDNTVCQNIKVSGCKFTNCLSGIGNHHGDQRSSGWVFENNTFTNMGYSCFIIENVKNVSISGNTWSSAYHFAEINDIDNTNVVIANNKITGSSSISTNCIKLTRSKGVNITGNTISGYKYGIIALKGCEATVSGNTISDCDLYAIRFTDGASSTGGITNNTVNNMKESGIGIKDFNGNISGNTVTNCALYGIKATGGGSGTIKGNTYDDSARGIYNISKLKTGKNIYLKDGIIVPEPDYYTIYYHLNEKAKASSKTTVAKYNVKTRSLTMSELGFSVSGKRFAGWKGYKTDSMTWRVVDQSGKDTWSDTLPAGYTYYLYREGHNFEAATRKGSEIHLYAVWESTGKSKLEVLSASVKEKNIKKNTKQEFDVTTEKNAKYLFLQGGDSIIKTWDAATYSTVKNGKRIWKDITITITEEREFVMNFRTGKTKTKPLSNRYFVFFNSLNCKKSGHNWDETVYTWSKDYSKVTATRTCKNNDSHVQTETVKTTSKITKKPTMSAGGTLIYTSKAFKNKAFQKQSISVDVPRIKASYKDKTGNYTIRKNMTAIYKGPAKKSVETVTIPETITVSGVKIKVVGIGSKAFKGCKNLEKITIKTTKLVDSAVKKDAFKGTSKDVIIKCPKSMLKKYRKLLLKKGVKNAKSIQS